MLYQLENSVSFEICYSVSHLAAKDADNHIFNWESTYPVNLIPMKERMDLKRDSLSVIIMTCSFCQPTLFSHERKVFTNKQEENINGPYSNYIQFHVQNIFSPDLVTKKSKGNSMQH